MAKKRAKNAKKKAPATPAKKAQATKKGVVRKSVKRSPPVRLTTEERQALLKPISNYDDLVERFVRTWSAEGSALKAPGHTPAKLASLLTRAKRTAEKEERLRAALEPKLEAAMDARLTAQDELWRTLMDIWAMAKAQARTQPELGTAFAFMADVFSRKSGSGASDDTQSGEQT